MMKAMQLAGGDDYLQAALDADKRLRTDSVSGDLLTFIASEVAEQPGRSG